MSSCLYSAVVDHHNYAVFDLKNSAVFDLQSLLCLTTYYLHMLVATHLNVSNLENLSLLHLVVFFLFSESDSTYGSGK